MCGKTRKKADGIRSEVLVGEEREMLVKGEGRGERFEKRGERFEKRGKGEDEEKEIEVEVEGAEEKTEIFSF